VIFASAPNHSTPPKTALTGSFSKYLLFSTAHPYINSPLAQYRKCSTKPTQQHQQQSTMVLFDEYKNRICPEFTTPKQEDSITKQEDRFAENGAGKKKESQWIYTHCNSTFAIVSTLASSYCDNGSSHSGNTHTVISPLTAFQDRLRRPRRLQY
jgi:hypothetical protein